MRIASIGKEQSFGVRLPQNFIKEVSSQCEGITEKEASFIADTLKKSGSDKITFLNISSVMKGFSLFRNSKNIVKMHLEAKKSDGNKIQHWFGEVFFSENPLTAPKIIEIAQDLIKKTESSLE